MLDLQHARIVFRSECEEELIQLKGHEEFGSTESDYSYRSLLGCCR